MKLLVTVVPLVAYLCMAIKADDDFVVGRILEGEDVVDCTKYPWHAQLPNGCGGSLITVKYVLTAAHCTDNCKVGSEISIQLGSTKIGNGKGYVGRLKVCHNLYKRVSSYFSYYDIAIFELTKSVDKTPCIDTIYNFRTPVRIPDDLPVTAIGFGLNENKVYPSILQETTDLRTFNLHLCEVQFRDSYDSYYAHICTKSKVAKNQAICNGDSGGSLSYKNERNDTYLIGITSFGEKNCDGGVSVYTRLNHPNVISWIEQMT